MIKETLDIKHFETLYPKLKELKYGISEYSFANLFLFRKKHQYEVISDKEIFISAKGYDNSNYIIPVFDVLKNISGDEFQKYLLSMVTEFGPLFPIPESALHLFDPGLFYYSYSDDDSDYVYTQEKMETYKGRKLHGKRNLLKQFLKYVPQSKPLTEDRKADAVSILNEWQENAGISRDETDYQACYEGIHMMEFLKICGCICYVDKEPAGFIIGEEISEDTFALHFVKGKKKFKGIYQYMYNNFAKILPESRYKYLNLEQDIGNLALRIAKSSYEPDIMIKKYRIGGRRKDE